MTVEVEFPKRSKLSKARRVGGGVMMMFAVFAASMALFSVVVFIAVVLAVGGAGY